VRRLSTVTSRSRRARRRAARRRRRRPVGPGRLASPRLRRPVDLLEPVFGPCPGFLSGWNCTASRR
jgi:hypothetical protein